MNCLGAICGAVLGVMDGARLDSTLGTKFGLAFCLAMGGARLAPASGKTLDPADPGFKRCPLDGGGDAGATAGVLGLVGTETGWPVTGGFPFIRGSGRPPEPGRGCPPLVSGRVVFGACR